MAYPTVIKKASIRRPFYFMKESGKSGWSALPFPPVAIGAEIPPIRMIGFEDGLSQSFGDIRAQPLYGAFEPFVGVTVPEIAFAFQVEDQTSWSAHGQAAFGRGPALHVRPIWT